MEEERKKKLKNHLNDKEKKWDVKGNCNYSHYQMKMVPQPEEDILLDEAMAKVATELSMTRHCGVLECVYTPMGTMFNQSGKDLLNAPYIIGTGGVIVHSKNPRGILESGKFNPAEPIYLKPEDPKFMVDKTYILSSMGLLAQKEPDLAIKIMKKYLIEV